MLQNLDFIFNLRRFVVDQRTRAKELEAAARARAASERARRGLGQILLTTSSNRHAVERTPVR
jgi:hypothetical protein